MLNFYTDDFKVITSSISKLLITDLLNEVTIALKIKNDSLTETYNNVGVFLKPSSDLGSVDKFSNKTPEASYQEIINWGEFDKGLSILNNNEETFFKLNSGSDNTSKIVLSSSLEPGQSVSFNLKLTRNEQVNAQRLFIGLEVE